VHRVKKKMPGGTSWDNGQRTTDNLSTEATKDNPGLHCTVSIANRYERVTPNFLPSKEVFCVLCILQLTRPGQHKSGIVLSVLLSIKTNTHISATECNLKGDI
jgi:hypothetical protein